MMSGAKARADAPWVEKYRPKSLNDVAAHKEIIDTSELAAAVPAGLVFYWSQRLRPCLQSSAW